jgi:hypothetical protein
MRRFLAICFASLALGTAGCGGGDDKPATVDARVIADAATKTSAAGTARVSTTVTGSYRGHELGLGTRTGIVDGKRNRAVLDFDFSFLGNTGAGPAPEEVTGTFVYYGDVVFAVTNALQMRYASGKGWYEVARDEVNEPDGPGAGIAGFGSVDPTRPVDLLRAAHGDAHPLGARRVDGTDVEGYSTVIDLTRYADIAAGERRGTFVDAVKTLEQSLGTPELPVEAWIASDGTVRRTKLTLTGRGLRLTFTTDLAQIGKPVTVRRPPRANVFDLRGR